MPAMLCRQKYIQPLVHGTSCLEVEIAIAKLKSKNRQVMIKFPMLGGVPVPTAWRILGLLMEERPPAMEVSCEYIE
jgi:hypothetical protein